jgi:hypothetical protein
VGVSEHSALSVAQASAMENVWSEWAEMYAFVSEPDFTQ